MKHPFFIRFTSILFLIVTFSSCKKSEAPAEEMALEIADSISSSAAVEKPNSDRKFIRTADLKFQVKSVTQSTYAIENITNSFDGFVTYTNLQSNVVDKLDTNISQDSTLETTRFSVENNITIRVPNHRLDTVIKRIAKEIDFLDYRIIQADDVSLTLLSNQLAQKRSKNQAQRIQKAIENKSGKVNDVVKAESELATQNENQDNAKIEKLTLNDQIKFSTIKILIYQRETVTQKLYVRAKDSDYFEPHLGIRIKEAIRSGWSMLMDIVVFLFQIWWFILFMALGWFFVYKKFLK